MKNLLKVKPLIQKHQLKNGKGTGRLTILFTPEQMAAIEANMLNTVPGTNVNSNRTVGETARRAGVEATRTRLRANYKRDKRRNVGEMHTYVASKERQDPITGEPIITETVDVGSNGSGAMSGRDPLLGTIFDLYTGTKAWNSGAKLLLWGAGKYMPSTMLGLWGRTGIINDVARRSFNPGGWGQVVARPIEKTSIQKGFSFNDLPQEKYIYNNRTGDFDVVAPKKEWIQKGEKELVPDYFMSPLEKERLIATGISPEEALEIMDVRWLNSIEALPGKLRNLGERTFGDTQNIDGRAFVRYNSRKGVKASLNNIITTLNTVFHELGGHGSSLNIGYGTQTIPINMKDILMKIYKHNESLRPLLKPFYQAIKDGDFDLAKNLAKDEGIELSSLKGTSGDVNFEGLRDFIKYMEENQEYSARAIGSNMSNHYGMPNGWNEQQLRLFFTDESVNKLLKNVWNYNIPIIAGGYTLYNTFNGPYQQSQIKKQGGKMFKFKKGNKIHIKKANRGKFTDYCGGEVTNECILRGKHSSNPAVRKRATFALNARHFKHKEGGLIQRLQLGNYFKKPIKLLAHLINNYGNSSYDGLGLVAPSITHTLNKFNKNKNNNSNLNKKWPTNSLVAAAASLLSPLLGAETAIPDVVFDVAASIDEPSTSNTLHTAADFPEAIAKVTPTKVDDYVARGVLMIGNVDDTLSAGGKNLFEIFDGNRGQVNNTIDKTSVRESTRVNSPKRIESIKRKKLGGIVKADNGIKFTLNDGINLGLNLYSTAKYNNAIDNQIKALNPLKDYYKNSIISKKYKDNIMKGFAERLQLPNSGTVINSNPDIDKHFYYTQAVNDSLDELNEINRSLELLKLNLQAQKKSILSSAANTALNYNNYDFSL